MELFQGLVHTSAGYLLYAGMTHQDVFDYKEGDGKRRGRSVCERKRDALVCCVVVSECERV